MMNLTPQSMRSPMSPYNQQPKQPFSSQRRYPATPQPEPTSTEQSNRGLGTFDCPLPQQQSTAQELPPSPQASDSWSHSSIMEPDFPQTSQPPDIFSAAFDPFSGYSTNANTGMVSTQSPEAPGLVFCQSPPSTNMPSHRSSISSSYSSPLQHGAEYYTPRVKVEDGSEWYPSPGNEPVLQRSLTAQGITDYSNGVSPIHGHSGDFYRNQPGEWAKPNPPVYGGDMNLIGEDTRSKFDAAPVLPSVNRIKKKRQRTTPEEATHECRVCGKLFKRSYNWKSHMETHNPERKYPHPCTAMVGNTQCTKKFQRKTDLDRHNDSVSIPLLYTISSELMVFSGTFKSTESPLQSLRQPIRPPRHAPETHRGWMPKAIRAWLPRRISGESSEMVSHELPSAQQILQWGDYASFINGTSNVYSANLDVFEL